LSIQNSAAKTVLTLIEKMTKNCFAADSEIDRKNCITIDSKVGSENCIATDSELGSENRVDADSKINQKLCRCRSRNR
jgi:hypothetical protein